jgi:hypothetical protein
MTRKILLLVLGLGLLTVELSNPSVKLTPVLSSVKCESMLYDKNGDGHIQRGYSVEYRLDAPLFLVDPGQIHTTSNQSGCLVFPSKIDPAVALKGTPIYPVRLTGQVERGNLAINSGQSILLSMQAEIVDRFSSDTWPIVLMPLQLEQLRFKLNAPAFDFQPSNDDAQLVAIGLGNPAKSEWVLFPKENASGEQVLQSEITSDEFYANTKINLKVNTLLGIDPRWWLIFGIILAAIGFVISNWATIKSIFTKKSAVDNITLKSNKKVSRNIKPTKKTAK